MPNISRAGNCLGRQAFRKQHAWKAKDMFTHSYRIKESAILGF